MLPLTFLVCCFLSWSPPQFNTVSGASVDPFVEGFNRTGFLIVPGTIAGQPANCLLDSGATISVVDLEIARSIPDRVRGPSAKSRTPSKVVEVQSLENIDRNCLNFPKQTGRANASDLSSFNADGGIRINAFLGMDYLQPLIFQFASERPRFIQRSEFVPDPAATIHLLKTSDHAQSHSMVSIDLPVLGEREFIIDTGYNDCVAISSDWIKRLLRAGEAVLLQEVVAVDGSGARKKTLYVIREIQILGITMRNVPALESELNLVGLGLMRHLDFSIDFKNSVAYILPSSRSVDAFDADASGLRTVFQPDHGLTVSRIMPASSAEKNKIEVGDQLLEIDGRIASELSAWEIRKLLSQAGKTIPLKVKSGDQVRDIQLPLSRNFEYPPKWKRRSTDADAFLKSLENDSKP